MRIYLFDIDGTLISSGGAGRLALADAMLAAFDRPLEHHVDLHGRTDRWIGKQLLESHGLENSHDNWLRLINEYLRLLPTKLQEREGCALPGAASLLEGLLAEGAAVGLLTGNVPAGADIKLTHFSLHTLVNSTCFGGYGDTRDDRNHLAADAVNSARKHVGREVPANEIWIIGDTPRDVLCARSVGARAVAVATGGYSMEQLADAEPDVLLETLEDWGQHE